MFDNTFVNPESYREFLRTGTWPDKTQIVLELRGSTSKGSINQHGHYQKGDVQGIEVHVKDAARFKGGWAFFGFDGDAVAEDARPPGVEPSVIGDRLGHELSRTSHGGAPGALVGMGELDR